MRVFNYDLRVLLINRMKSRQKKVRNKLIFFHFVLILKGTLSSCSFVLILTKVLKVVLDITTFTYEARSVDEESLSSVGKESVGKVVVCKMEESVGKAVVDIVVYYILDLFKSAKLILAIASYTSQTNRMPHLFSPESPNRQLK